MEEKIASTPKYTPNQELANSISHAFGAFLALLGFPFLIVKAAYTGNPWSVVACSLFFFGMMMTYVGSAIYHGLKPSKAKDVWRILDHCNIFLLIIGSYSPYCLVSLREAYPAWGWSIYGIVVGLGILGIVLNAVSLKKFKVFSMINYLLMGWIIIISFYPLTMAVGFYPGVFLLLMGGIAYTIGAVLYGLGGRKNQWFHFIFHIFCLIGTIFMFFSIYFFVL